MNVIVSSEEQKLKLESGYQEMLSKQGLVNPMLVVKNKRFDDTARWPIISLMNIFAYILEKKKCAIGNRLDVISTKKHMHIEIVNFLAPSTYVKHILKKLYVFILFS